MPTHDTFETWFMFIGQISSMTTFYWWKDCKQWRKHYLLTFRYIIQLNGRGLKFMKCLSIQHSIVGKIATYEEHISFLNFRYILQLDGWGLIFRNLTYSWYDLGKVNVDICSNSISYTHTHRHTWQKERERDTHMAGRGREKRERKFLGLSDNLRDRWTCILRNRRTHNLQDRQTIYGIVRHVFYRIARHIIYGIFVQFTGSLENK